LTRDGSKDVFSRKNVPFWGLKMLKLTLNPFLCPKRQILAKKWTYKNFGRKRFKMETLIYTCNHKNVPLCF